MSKRSIKSFTLQVRLPEAVYKELQRLSFDAHLSISEYVRLIIDWALFHESDS